MADDKAADKAAVDKAAADKKAAEEAKANPPAAPVATTAATAAGTVASTADAAARNKAAATDADLRAQAEQDAIKRATDGQPFVFAGRPNQAFTIRGNGFGASGTLRIGDTQVLTSAWGNNVIRGVMPADAKPGDVVINPGMPNEQRGSWPQKSTTVAASRMVTVRTPDGKLVQGELVQNP